MYSEEEEEKQKDKTKSEPEEIREITPKTIVARKIKEETKKKKR